MEPIIQAYLVGVVSGVLLLAAILIAFVPVRGGRK